MIYLDNSATTKPCKLTGFTQKNPIIGYLNPWQSNFDASCIWGPIMAQKFYAGLRFTLWK